LRFKNSGAYPVRITGIVGADGAKATTFAVGASCGLGSGAYNISDYFYLAPGEEKYLAWGPGYGATCNWQVKFLADASSGVNIGGASSLCANSTSAPGTVNLKSMGFEYIEYLDNGQAITKREIGKPAIIKCLPA